MSFGLFKDALGYKERDFVFLNSDQALYRFKCRMLEYMQLHPAEGLNKAAERRLSLPRFPWADTLNTLYFPTLRVITVDILSSLP